LLDTNKSQIRFSTKILPRFRPPSKSSISAISGSFASPIPSVPFDSRLISTQARIAYAFNSSKRQSSIEASLCSLGADFILESSIPEKLDKSLEPRVSKQRNVLIWTCVGADGSTHSLRCLADSGAELDMIDSQVARRLGLVIQSLTRPLLLLLGTAGRSDHLSKFVTTDFKSGQIVISRHPFFVGNVQGYDVILGLPSIEETDLLVGSGRVERIDSKIAKLSPSSDLSFLPIFSDETGRLMTEDEAAQFSKVDVMIQGMVDGDKFIADEDHNPLSDVVDDPSVLDYTADEAKSRADALLVEFDDVLCDDLPNCLPPFRSVNHNIVLIIPI
jgi:hypothetical protein